jgi:hypothetical protein
MLNVSSRRLYRIYTASIIAALGIAMISTSNLNSSPTAAFAAEEQQHKGVRRYDPKIPKRQEQLNLFSAQMARP